MCLATFSDTDGSCATTACTWTMTSNQTAMLFITSRKHVLEKLIGPGSSVTPVTGHSNKMAVSILLTLFRDVMKPLGVAPLQALGSAGFSLEVVSWVWAIGGGQADEPIDAFTPELRLLRASGRAIMGDHAVELVSNCFQIGRM